MAYIVVITFDDESEAIKARQSLGEAQKHGYLELGDAVTIVKQPDGKVRVKDEFDKAVALGAFSGGFLGLLISSFFFPIMGLVLGAIGGGLVGKMVGMGVDKKFIQEVSEALQPGTSAIFLVIRGEYLSYMIALFEPYQGKIYHTSLPEDAEESLREVLSKRIGQLDYEMIALGFEGQITANEMLDKAISWQDRGIIKLEDAVVASRGYDDQVRIHQTKTLTGQYALKGGGIGLLAGLLLGGPIGGLVVGAAALADALLHPQDRAYSVPQLFDFIRRGGMRFGRWLRQAPYSPLCGVIANIPQASQIAQLPLEEQYAAIELFRGTMLRHSVILYRNDGPGDLDRISFTGDTWSGYVPIRMADTICVQERLPPEAAAVLINQTHTYTDLFLPINSTEKRWFDAVDGKRSIGEVLERTLPTGRNKFEQARSFFERLWWYDQVVFETSG